MDNLRDEVRKYKHLYKNKYFAQYLDMNIYSFNNWLSNKNVRLSAEKEEKLKELLLNMEVK